MGEPVHSKHARSHLNFCALNRSVHSIGTMWGSRLKPHRRLSSRACSSTVRMMSDIAPTSSCLVGGGAPYVMPMLLSWHGNCYVRAHAHPVGVPVLPLTHI